MCGSTLKFHRYDCHAASKQHVFASSRRRWLMSRGTRKVKTSRSPCVALTPRSCCLLKTMELVFSRRVCRAAATSRPRWDCVEWKNVRWLLLDGWTFFQHNRSERKFEPAFLFFTPATEMSSLLSCLVQSRN